MATRSTIPSRLPRLPSSPDRGMVTRRPKRKATDDIDAAPAKLQAMMEPEDDETRRHEPLRELNRGGANVEPPSRPVKPLSKSVIRPLSASSRGGSAPPMKIRPVVGIVGGRRTTPDPTTGRSGTRVVSGPSRTIAPIQEERNDLNALAALMNADRAKFSDLLEKQSKVASDLGAVTKDLELRRGMIAAADELEDIKRRHERDIQNIITENTKKDKELEEARDILREVSDDLGRERETVRTLKNAVSEHSNSKLLLEAQVTSLRMRCEALSTEGQAHQSSKAQISLDLRNAKDRIAELEEELRDAETLRRKLHNQIQELKGNIRVFCRVRPRLCHEQGPEADLAPMKFPDQKEHKEIVLSSTTESAMGSTRDTVLPFSFDRVFEPESTQTEVFEEISHLVQSCIDGYNVCIFAYGQTGSGKSFTMEGALAPELIGMIPRAVHHVFRTAESLQKKGWTYSMEGQFLEIYNESIVDLLGKSNDGKHEIKHDKNGKTTVTDAVVYTLRNANQVQSLLAHAQSRRTVHATLMNERSSRSHSVFTLRVSGKNIATGETCEGTLNLVDLAGSERIEKSGAQNDKDRLKEAQSINKSLSALGDVIAALGEKSAVSEKHIPYRNSKLTYLLQNSLGGNSKTLMFVNVSPLATHFGESVCSLRFATKVNNTTIGTARKQQARIAS